MDRNSVLLAGLDGSMLGLEIGAGPKPIARKAAGWNVKVVDHATQAALREKYQSHSQVDINQIEEVDIVWSAQALHDCVGPEEHHTFDYCLASHVVEHIPDLLTFFHSMETLLSPSGVLSLAVPDKRFCFDAFKPISTTADVLQSHMLRHRATRHTGKTRFENIAYNVTSGENRTWGLTPLNELGIFSSLAEAAQAFDLVAEDPASPYLDCPAWYFTPSSFQLLITELRALGHTRLFVEQLCSTANAEFLVRMRLDPPGAPARLQPSEDERMALMIAILAEQTQQYSLISKTLHDKTFKLLPKGHPVPDLDIQNAQLDKQQEQLNAQQEQLDRQQEQLDRQQEQLDRQQEQLDRQQEQLDKILHSYSWRLVSAFWTGVDRLKKIVTQPGATLTRH